MLSPHLAASLLMVDVENPVFSPRRASLLTFVPDTAALGRPDAFTAAFTGGLRLVRGDLLRLAPHAKAAAALLAAAQD